MFSPWMILLCCDTWQQSFVSHQGCPCTAEVISYGGNVLVVVTPLTSRLGRVNNAQNIYLPFLLVSSFFSNDTMSTEARNRRILSIVQQTVFLVLHVVKSSLLLRMGHSIHGAVVIWRRRHRVWTPVSAPVMMSWWVRNEMMVVLSLTGCVGIAHADRDDRGRGWRRVAATYVMMLRVKMVMMRVMLRVWGMQRRGRMRHTDWEWDDRGWGRHRVTTDVNRGSRVHVVDVRR